MRANRTNRKPSKRKRRKKQLKVLLILLILAIAGTAVTIYRDYEARPGFLEKVWISERGGDYLTVAWERPRNVSKFVVTCNGKTIEVNGRKKEAKVKDLKEDTFYTISVRADSKEREGFESLKAQSKTKKFAWISGKTKFTKFANRPIDLHQTAKTPITFTAADGSITRQYDKVVFNKSGKIKVLARTEETDEYASTTKEITVKVLDTVNTDAGSAQPHVFYKLDKNNCKCVRVITGTDEVVYPQAFVKYGDNYLVTYIKGDQQRLITFGSGKTVEEPELDLGHANGLTLVDGRCYMVEGYSGKCTSFDLDNTNYDSFELPYAASGIAYDDSTDMFYTSSRKRLVAYDRYFNEISQIGLVNRRDEFYVQDICAYGGLMLHGVSGSDEQGTNYIDFYDMTQGTYLGTIECELNEIESLLVDDEGYIEIMSNARGDEDYIWKTPVNMKSLCE